MNFKKDLSRLAYIASDGKGKLVNIKYTDKEVDREISLFMNGSLGITTEIFETELILSMLDLISRKYKGELVEQGKSDEISFGDEFYSNTIKDIIEEGNRYNYGDFDRYQEDNICPEKETMGLSIGFLDKITKLFDVELQYVFKGDYIVGVEAYTVNPLFIVGGVSMPKQLNLLSGDHE